MAAIRGPISVITFSAGTPCGRVLFGAFRPPGIWPNLISNVVASRCFSVGEVAMGFPAFRQRSKPFHCAGIGEIKMLEHLRSVPLPFWMPRQIFNRHAARSRGERFLQSLKVEIHSRPFRFV